MGMGYGWNMGWVGMNRILLIYLNLVIIPAMLSLSLSLYSKSKVGEGFDGKKEIKSIPSIP